MDLNWCCKVIVWVSEVMALFSTIVAKPDVGTKKVNCFELPSRIHNSLLGLLIEIHEMTCTACLSTAQLVHGTPKTNCAPIVEIPAGHQKGLLVNL